MSKSGAVGLGELPWIMTPDDCPFHQLAENFFKTNNIQPQKVALVDKETVIRTMIQAGAGLSMMLERDLLQRASAEDEASGLTVWAEQEMCLPLSIVCLQTRKDEVLQQTLFATMTRIFHERS